MVLSFCTLSFSSNNISRASLRFPLHSFQFMEQSEQSFFVIMEQSEQSFFVRLKLTALFFLQFAVWGAYLTSMGGYLAKVGMGTNIGWFYSVQGLVSIFMPTLMGIVADRFVPAQRLFGFCHLASAALMAIVGYVGLSSPDVSFATLFPIYSLAVAFYMPTLSLASSVSYTAMQAASIDKVSVFPKIRIWGTVGFIVSMLLVDYLGFQHAPQQFFVCSAWGLILGVYSFSLPNCPVSSASGSASIVQRMGLDAFKLFRSSRMFLFFLFSMLLGVSLQITNGYANPFISSFGKIQEFADAFFVEHANLLISLSQVSETLCILLIPFFLKRYGIKAVMHIAMFAWFFRFWLFNLGSPTWPGVLFFIGSMVVYGVAFDFFNISGSLFVDSEVEPSMRSSAQGLFVLMTNGLGASIGTLAAQAVVNHFVSDSMSPAEQIDGWRMSWAIFAVYALVVAVSFALVFKGRKSNGCSSL